jgi:hypothetical protein
VTETASGALVVSILAAASLARQQGDFETATELLAILDGIARRAVIMPPGQQSGLRAAPRS